MENCHPCSDFYCIQHPFNVGVRVFCALVLSSSSSHCDRALFIAQVSIYVISDMYTVRAFSLSSRMIFWCFLYTIKVGLIQCLFTHSRSRAFLSCVSNAGNFSFRACTYIYTHTVHVALIFLSVLRWAFLTLTTGSEMLMQMFVVKNYYELKEREISAINLKITHSWAFSIATI